MLQQTIKDFKEFAVKGNVVDLAVAVIIGGAFGKIVTSMVNDLVMPAVGYLLGGVNFSELKWVLREANPEAVGQLAEAVTINYGNFIQAVVDFLIIAWAIFLAIKVISRFKRKEEVVEKAKEEAKPDPQIELLTEIRDSLKK